jgi:F-type H+-transporting ATPase subunit a
MLLAFLQSHGNEAAQAAEHGAQAAGGHGGGHHVPVVVEWLNHSPVGSAVYALQQQIMPPIYGLFGAHWPGEGMDYHQYIAAGNLPIPTHIVMFLIVVFFSVVVLWFLRGKLSTESPTTRQQTFEVGVETIRGLLADLAGPHGAKHFPVIATFATLILFSNLLGMVPDMMPPTANLNVTLALAVTSFLYYNYVGIREAGLVGHLKHFAGPVRFGSLVATVAIGLFMLPIELISNFARILSLSLRLFGNIFGEEQVSGVIGGMVPWVLPMLLYPLGLMAAILQTFIFIVLSMIYIGEVSHHGDEGHGEGHGASHGPSHGPSHSDAHGAPAAAH